MGNAQEHRGTATRDGIATDIPRARITGKCDAFAIAMHNFLLENKINSRFIVLSRKRVAIDDHDDIIDENLLSHVLLETLNETFDVWGWKAVERWRTEWIQPEYDDERVPCKDIFNEQIMSVEQLHQLRKKCDGCDIDKKAVKKYAQWIEKNLLLQEKNRIINKP